MTDDERCEDERSENDNDGFYAAEDSVHAHSVVEGTISILSVSPSDALLGSPGSGFHERGARPPARPRSLRTGS